MKLLGIRKNSNIQNYIFFFFFFFFLLLLLLLLLLIYSFESFWHQHLVVVFYWDLSDSKSPQISRTLLSIFGRSWLCCLDSLHSCSYFRFFLSLYQFLVTVPSTMVSPSLSWCIVFCCFLLLFFFSKASFLQFHCLLPRRQNLRFM